MSANPAIRRFQCRHIFTDGRRCGSPCLRDQAFCYYHNTTRRPNPELELKDPYNYPPNQCPINLPLPEDRSAIQLSIGQIMRALADNSLDPRRAGLLLYALQIASINVKNAPTLNPDEIVHDVTLDPTDGHLAPENELPADQKSRESFEALYEDDEEAEEEDDNEDEEDEDDEEEEDEDEEDEDDEEEEDEDEEDNGDNSLNLRASAAVPQTASLSQTAPKTLAGTDTNRFHQPARTGTPTLTPASDLLYKKVPPGDRTRYRQKATGPHESGGSTRRELLQNQE